MNTRRWQQGPKKITVPVTKIGCYDQRTTTLVAIGWSQDDACEQWFGGFCIDWTKKEWVMHQLVWLIRSLKWENGPLKLESMQIMEDIETVIDDDWSKWWLKIASSKEGH